MKNKTQKQEIPTIKICFPDSDKVLADLERGIAECRQRAIEHMAEEYGVSIEQANRMADEISEQAYVAYTNKRKK